MRRSSDQIAALSGVLRMLRKMTESWTDVMVIGE